ncbi:MAG: hypothetical protein PHZ07_05150 [Patescibacteria group bacterium]|nr:hypothetical protein [Patescibacteria group bacterium]MDD4304813.1 hypothetical protein [Patescibacteria group bacterium]MDD4695857.1 hypothetical protein [Patescibacteria group bacterium]
MDENKNELNPLEEKKQPIIEDVFSDLPNTIGDEIINNTSQEEINIQYEAIEKPYKQNIEPKITTYEPEQIESTYQKEKSPKKLLFTLILALILIVGGFVIWVIL